MKKCFKCNKEKSIDDFYKHPKMADGRLNKCKDCSRKESIKNLKKKSKSKSFIEQERKRGREKYFRLNYIKRKADPKKKKAAMERYFDKFPEKKKATLATYNMKSKVKGNHMHHWSYNDEHLKDVIELTTKQHRLCHRFMIYDQERRMFRTLEGVLLDTKEAHLGHTQYIIKNHNDTSN